MKVQNNLYNSVNIKLLSRLLMLMMISFSLLTFVGCGSDDPTPAGPSNNDDNEEPMDTQGANEVWMQASSFNVANLEVSAGTTVTWTNKSNANHTVTSGSRGDADAGDLFDSGTISPGASFTHTFDDAGSFAYFCDFHSGMDAEVTVTE